jgi:hypothetical protein
MINQSIIDKSTLTEIHIIIQYYQLLYCARALLTSITFGIYYMSICCAVKMILIKVVRSFSDRVGTAERKYIHQKEQ